MKKTWRILAAAAAVAAIVPYQVRKDEETGHTAVRALLWSAIRPRKVKGAT